jgi:hypothetical protein
MTDYGMSEWSRGSALEPRAWWCGRFGRRSLLGSCLVAGPQERTKASSRIAWSPPVSANSSRLTPVRPKMPTDTTAVSSSRQTLTRRRVALRIAAGPVTQCRYRHHEFLCTCICRAAWRDPSHFRLLPAAICAAATKLWRAKVDRQTRSNIVCLKNKPTSE